MAVIKIPSRDQVGPETPLRLSVAAALAFPDGSMTASGLRREAARGRLVVERIAGKDYTTLANIERMRELCRVEAKVPGCGSGPPAGKAAASLRVRSGSSSTAIEHIATGCLRHQAGEAEKRLAAYIADKYQPSRLSSGHRPDRRRGRAVNLSRRLRAAARGPAEAGTDASAGSTTTGAARCCPKLLRPSAVPTFKRAARQAALGRSGDPARRDQPSRQGKSALRHRAGDPATEGTATRPVAHPRRGRQTDLGLLAISRTTDRASRSRRKDSRLKPTSGRFDTWRGSS